MQLGLSQNQIQTIWTWYKAQGAAHSPLLLSSHSHADNSSHVLHILSTCLPLGFHSFIEPTFTEHLVCAFHCALSDRNGYDRSLPWKAYEPREEGAMQWLATRPVQNAREQRALQFCLREEETRGHKGGELALIHQVHWGWSNERGAGVGNQRGKWESHIESRAKEWWWELPGTYSAKTLNGRLSPIDLGHEEGQGRRQNSKIDPSIPTFWCTCLYNSLPWRVSRNMIQLHCCHFYLIWRKGVDFEIIKRDIILGGPELIKWII